MGLLDFISKQFIDVIEWTETQNGVLAYRYPMADHEIQTGGRLTVRDSQMALFVNEGVIADQFGPGLYTLNTQNLPVLTNLKNWDKAFASPFKSDVYFFSTREQIDQKWGTAQPVTIRDKEFGPIRIRTFGNYAYHITDPKVFYQKISGSREVYTTQELEGQLRGIVLSNLANYFGSASVGFVDMAANQTEFSQKLLAAIAPSFLEYGLELKSFFVESISLPGELQTHFDRLASMNLLGDLGRYAKFQTAESIPVAAANPGGLAGAGASLGAGVAIGQTMASALGGGTAPGGGAASSEMDETLALIEKLHGLFKKGILTETEFEAKKQELLKKFK